eukprot:7302996-Karenia_brevis.AAC.1
MWLPEILGGVRELELCSSTSEFDEHQRQLNSKTLTSELDEVRNGGASWRDIAVVQFGCTDLETAQ